MSTNRDDLSNLAVLVGRLPRQAVRALIAELPAGGTRSERSELARQALIDQLNGQRTSRARRLLTSLVEPLLVDDPVLLEAGGLGTVPGLVQRADIAGLWAALLSGGLRVEADSVQARLDSLCRDAVIDDVFRLPEAEAMRAGLRASALALIDAAGASAPGRARFLAVFNAARAADAAKLGWPHRLPPLTWTAIERLRALFSMSDVLLPTLTELAQRIGEASGDAAVEAAMVARILGALAARIEDEAAREIATIHAVAVVLHRRRRYDVLGPVLREAAADPEGAGPQVIDAAMAHLAGTARALVRRLKDACAEAGTVTLDAAGRAELDRLLERHTRVLEAAVAAQLADHRTHRYAVRGAFAELEEGIETVVVPRLTACIAAAGAARRQPTRDHADVVRLAGWVLAWRGRLERAGISGTLTVAWVDDALRGLHQAFDAAIRLEPDVDLLERMAQLGRLHELAECLGTDIRGWLKVISVNTMAIIRRRLEDPRPLDGSEAAVAGRFLDLVEAEMGRTRNWQVNELVEFRDAARRRIAV